MLLKVGRYQADVSVCAFLPWFTVNDLQIAGVDARPAETDSWEM